MGLNTDFSQSPYFDDFDETKNFHKVLFKPAVAVQARELTQLQTILQNQIERFGDNIVTEGTIIQGGNFIEEKKLAYAKILDIAKNTSGAEVATDVNQYIGMKAIGQQTGVEAIIIFTEYGLESDGTNLNTIYLKYTKGNVVSNTNVRTFAAGEEIQLKVRNGNGDYVNDYHLITVAPTTITTNPIGTGYGVRCGEGIIYQKGHFIRFENALTVVSKYSNTPDGVVVGFQTEESVIDSNEDSSILDNANGFNNFNAPGADRLKLVPSLVVKTIEEAKADETFFAIQEYANGKVVRRRLQTQYSTIEKEMERRTAEESGDYVVSRFNVRSDKDPVNSTQINAYVSKGLAYVDGQRVELINEIKIPIDEANTFLTVQNQDINTNYGMYVNVTSYTGRFDFTTFEQVNLKDGATPIGTARVRSVTKESATEYRLYIFAIKMGSGYSFGDTTTIESALGSATVTLVSGKAVLLDASFNKLFFPIGKSFIKSVDETETNFIYRTSTDLTITSNSFSFSTADIFPYNAGALTSDDLLDFIVSAKAAGSGISNAEILEISSATLDTNLNYITINLVKNANTSLPIAVYYNVKKDTVTFDDKLLQTVYVKVQANTNASGVSGTYSLGLPDVYNVEGIWRGDASIAWATLETNATSNSATNNVTSSFGLLTNQYDDYYGLSKIRKKKSFTVGADDKIILKVKVFKKGDDVGHFFACDSYPVDDTSTVLPANAIRTENIPAYTATDGITYYLRDVIDLRPYASNTAAYSLTASSATINPALTETFSNLEFPAPRQRINTKYSYYLSRKDILVIDQNGDFELIKGVPGENSSYPPEPTKGMLLARLSIPPFPTLDTNTANILKKADYGVSIESNQTRRYTMKDIGGIDKRISSLEYYTSLSLLESNAKDFQVTDSSGANRFKNGIFVDNFKTLFLADVNGGEFAAAIDQQLDNITPKVRQYNLGLKYSSGGTGVTTFANKVATLNKTDYPLNSASQPYATALKNCTTSFYNYVGKMQINPTYDTGPDTERAPAINFEMDLATPFIEYTEALSEFITFTNSERRRLNNRVTQITTTELDVGAGNATTQNLGDFVTNVNFLPYMRSRKIQIRVVGLRPNTRFFFFFDGVNVNNHVINAVDADAVEIAAGTAIVSPRGGFTGSPVVIESDSDGVLRAVFKIPEATFFVGDRKLEILDVPDIADKDAATSYASTNYSAFNFAVTQTNLSTTTIPPQFDIDTTVTTQTQRGGGGSDPIAQTFIIDPDASSDTNVFISKIDLFFAKKSRAGKGVGIQIREVQNGFPTGPALPFSSIHLKASQVNAPSDTPLSNALQATTVIFEAPVALRTNTEYAIVVAPDGNDPDYLMWISRTGERDVDTGVAITQDSNAGVLFTSTNAKTWTPYQNENLKFTIYASRFSNATGSLKLTNDNHEFFTFSDLTGKFVNAEEVFIQKGAGEFSNGTVTLVEGSNIVTGSGTNFGSQYGINKHIITYNGTDYQALKIKTVNNDTQMTLFESSRYSASNIAAHYASPVGRLIYFNQNEPTKMILESSTAGSDGFVFTANTLVRGETSEATAKILSVDDLQVSYIQPMISRANFSKTRTTLTADKLYDGSTTASRDIGFNETNYLTNDSYVIQSKSANPGTSTFSLTVDLLNTTTGTQTRDTSPLINFDASSIMIGEYIVNNTTDNSTNDSSERIGLGESKARYVSKMVQLADGMDAEDIRVLLGGYKPTGTDIRVYVKFLSSTDSRNFKEVEWTRLYVKPETNSTSSSVNREDYREFEYQLGTTALGNGLGAWNNSDTINYKDPTGALYTNYKYFAVKIVLLANSYSLVPRLKDLRVLALS